jgi:hypothetical protein
MKQGSCEASSMLNEFPEFVQPVGSLPCSQELATGLSAEADESNQNDDVEKLIN